MTKKTTLFTALGCISGALILGSCGGGGGGSNSGGSGGGSGADTTNPNVSFQVSTASIDSQGTTTVAVNATDNIGVTSGPNVTCTNGGVYANGVFTAPIVTTQTVSVCTATASDAAGNSGSGTLTVTINVPTAITLTGTVGKGLTSGATIQVRDAADGFGADPIAVATTNSAGVYSVTLPEGSESIELFVVEAQLAGAIMVCDAANCLSEVGLAFGESFLVPEDIVNPDGSVRQRVLTTPLPTPALGTTEVNINVFSHYNLMSMVRPAFEGRVDQTSVPKFLLSDYGAAREGTANLFGLPNADFFAISFIDVTQPITSNSQNEIYAALISGGVLGAANEADDPFGAVLELQFDAVGTELIVNESTDDINLISLEDIFENASALATQLNLSTNAFTLAQDALSTRQSQITSAAFDQAAASDGTLPAP